MGSNVSISCEYALPLSIAANWIIDGIWYSYSELSASPLYQVNLSYNSSTNIGISTLTILTINNNITLQCLLPLASLVSSTVGILTLAGKFVR